QRLNMYLLAGNRQICAAGRPRKAVGPGPFGKRLDDGPMSLVTGSFRAVYRRRMLQGVKIAAPFVGNTTWIDQIGVVELFNVGRVVAEQIRVGKQFLKI